MHWHPEVAHENVPQPYFNRGSQAGRLPLQTSNSRFFSDLLTFPMQQLHSHHPPENFPKCIFREQIFWLEIRFVDDYPPHQQRIVCCHLQEFGKILISPLHTASKFQSLYWKRGRKTYMTSATYATNATYLLTFSWFHPPELISP